MTEFRYSEYNDFYRDPTAHKSGGFALHDQEIIDKYKGAMKELVTDIGRKLFTGNFDWATVAFPIKAQSPESILKCMVKPGEINTYYFSQAAMVTDAVERMKFTICGAMTYMHGIHNFNKPLNPMLGETYQAVGDDGSKWYLEKIIHRPPTMYMLCEAPNLAYRWYGYD